MKEMASTKHCLHFKNLPILKLTAKGPSGLC